MAAAEAWDEAAWAALVAELDTWRMAGQVATLWWRDDDVGGAHPALARLLALSARTAVPLALAVVPAWLEDAVVAWLATAPGPLAVLQHGVAHRSHEPPPPGGGHGRPAECGPARPAGAVLAELAEAGAALRARLGPRGLPVLVPPWNRIAPAVTAGLPVHGYRGLSTFGPRTSVEPAAGLRQVNGHVDPIVWRAGKRFAGAAATLEALRGHLEARRRHRVDPAEPTGLLTHHQVLPEAGWTCLEALLDRLPAHPAVAFPPPAALFGLA